MAATGRGLRSDGERTLLFVLVSPQYIQSG
jgi:hypothetical protein